VVCHGFPYSASISSMCEPSIGTKGTIDTIARDIRAITTLCQRYRNSGATGKCLIQAAGALPAYASAAKTEITSRGRFVTGFRLAKAQFSCGAAMQAPAARPGILSTTMQTATRYSFQTCRKDRRPASLPKPCRDWRQPSRRNK